MDNGNILAISWENSGDEDLLTEVIIEIEKDGATGGNIVWEWDIWDHLDELGLDPDDARNEDWIHLNGIDYKEASDQIMVSSRSHSEVWIFNKSDGSIETISSLALGLSGQHDPKWIDDEDANSNITIFNNGQSQGYSQSIEVDSSLSEIIWSYGNSSSAFTIEQKNAIISARFNKIQL